MNPNLKKGNIIAVGLLLSFFACKKDNFQPVKTDNPNSEIVTHDRLGFPGDATINYIGTFEGVVVDAQQNPVAGAEVKSAYQSVITDNQGRFKISKLNSGNNTTYLIVSKHNYFKTFINAQNSSEFLKAVLNKPHKTISFNSNMGSYVQNNHYSVVFEENSFLNADGSPYNGIVNVSMVFLVPDSSWFSGSIPGSNLKAVNKQGEEVQLYSYGMFGAEITDNKGNELKLAKDKSAIVNLHIPYSQIAHAPNEIPLWHFDEEKGIWIEEGKANKTGYYYRAEVSHFSYWNVDVPAKHAEIEGKIIDCNNNPLPYHTITVGQTSIQTDKEGTFRCFIPSGRDDLKVVFDNLYKKDEKINLAIPRLNEYSVYKHPDIKVSCGKILTADIIGCDNQPKVAEVSLIHNGKKLNTQISYLGHVQFPVPVDVNSGLELVLAYVNNSIPVITYPVNTALNEIINYTGQYKLCKSAPDANGFFFMLDSAYNPVDEVNEFYANIVSATATYSESKNKVTIKFTYSSKDFRDIQRTGEIEIIGSSNGIYNLSDTFWKDSVNKLILYNYPIYASYGGTVEIVDWANFGGKVKVRVNALMRKETHFGPSYGYFGTYHITNFLLEANRMMDAD